MKKSLYLYVSFLVLGLSLFFIINSVFAWTLPTANPPQGDLPAPLDTSSIEQTKVGNLNLDNNLKVGGLLRLGLYTSHPTGTNGNLYYNTSDHKFYGYQNNEWKELGGGAGFWLASGDDIYNTNTGNVGIGMTEPTSRLHINPTVTATTDAKMFQSGIVYNGATAMTNWYGAYISAPTGTGTITNKYALVTEANAGNVGIGTTSPGQKLAVAGNIDVMSNKIVNLATPTAASDAATKGYVDATDPTLTCEVVSCSATVPKNSYVSCTTTCTGNNVIFGAYWEGREDCYPSNIYPLSPTQLNYKFFNTNPSYTWTSYGRTICCSIM